MSAPAEPSAPAFDQNRVSAAVWPWSRPASPPAAGHARRTGPLFLQAAAGFSLAALLALVFHFRHLGAVVATTTALLLLLGLAAPAAHAKLIGAVLRGVNAVGSGLTAVLLPALYFSLFLLIGILRRLGGNDSMARAFPPPPGSLWTPRRAPASNDEYQRQF